jgi:addiction module HigA family antidote
LQWPRIIHRIRDAVIRELCLDPLGLGVGETGDGLGVEPETFADLLDGRLGISGETALRLSLAFGGSAERWLQQQALYDLAQVRRSAPALHVRRFVQNPGHLEKFKVPARGKDAPPFSVA